MTTVGFRIRRQRLSMGMSQDALGKKVGVSRVAVSEWERNVTLPKAKNVPALSRALQLPESAFNPFGTGGVVLAIDDNAQSARIPHISWGDLPRLARGESVMDLAKHWVAVAPDLDIHEDDYRLDVVDVSMAPDFNQGDKIRVRRGIKPSDGSYVVVIPFGETEAMLRRYQVRRGGAVDLVPESPDYPTLSITKDRPAQVLGVVVRHVRILFSG